MTETNDQPGSLWFELAEVKKKLEEAEKQAEHARVLCPGTGAMRTHPAECRCGGSGFLWADEAFSDMLMVNASLESTLSNVSESLGDAQARIEQLERGVSSTETSQLLVRAENAEHVLGLHVKRGKALRDKLAKSEERVRELQAINRKRYELLFEAYERVDDLRRLIHGALGTPKEKDEEKAGPEKRRGQKAQAPIEIIRQGESIFVRVNHELVSFDAKTVPDAERADEAFRMAIQRAIGIGSLGASNGPAFNLRDLAESIARGWEHDGEDMRADGMTLADHIEANIEAVLQWKARVRPEETKR